MHSLRNIMSLKALRLYAIVVVLMFVCAQSLGAMHIHADSGIDVHCDICVHADNASAVTPSVGNIDFAIASSSHLSHYSYQTAKNARFHTFLSRAPPVAP